MADTKTTQAQTDDNVPKLTLGHIYKADLVTGEETQHCEVCGLHRRFWPQSFACPAKSEAAMTWLPMSEAPRDGDRIVVWYIEDRQWICVCWMGHKWREVGTGYFYADDEFSHWLRIGPPH